MTVVAPKAEGHKKAIAPKAAIKVSAKQLAEVFGAAVTVPVPGGGDPLTRWQLMKELKSLVGAPSEGWKGPFWVPLLLEHRLPTVI